MYQSMCNVDSQREDGLKKTSLSVLDQRKQHKTGMQKTFQQFNQQRMTKAEQQQYTHGQMYQHGMGSQDMMRPPRHQSIQSSRSNPSFTSMGPPPPVMSGDHLSMSPNGPLLQQGQWNDKRVTGISQTSSEFTFDRMPVESPPMESGGAWFDNNIQEQLDRLVLLEEENLQLREMNGQLREDNSMLLGHIQEDARAVDLKSMEEALEIKTQEIKLLQQANAELEAQVVDMTQNMTKLKLITKTAQDKKDREIATLTEEVEVLEKEVDSLEKELDNIFNRQVSTTRDTSPMASPLSSSSVKDDTQTPPNVATATFSSPFQSNGKKDTTQQMDSTMKEEVIQDLLATIRSLRSDMELVKSERLLLMKHGEKDKRIIKLLAGAKNHKVKIRRGLTLVSQVDTLI